MIYIALLTITALFFIFALIISPNLKRLSGVKLCAICSACSSTWISLLVLRQFDIVEVDNTLIGVLMGGSVVGIMFELQKYFKKNEIKRFWVVRLLEIISGFYLAYSVAIWDVDMILIGSISAILVIIVTLMLANPFKKKKTKDKKSKKEDISEDEKQEAIKKLEESLDDCC